MPGVSNRPIWRPISIAIVTMATLQCAMCFRSVATLQPAVARKISPSRMKCMSRAVTRSSRNLSSTKFFGAHQTFGRPLHSQQGQSGATFQSFMEYARRFFSDTVKEHSAARLNVVETLTRTMVHRMRVHDLRVELAQRGLEESLTTVKNRAQLVSLLLEKLHPGRPQTATAPSPQSHVGQQTGPVRVKHVATTIAQNHLSPVKAMAEATRQETLLEGKEVRSLDDDPVCINSIKLDPARRHVLRLKGISDANSGTGVGLVLLDETDDRVVWHGRKYYPASRSLYEAEYTGIVLALRFGLRRFELRNLRVQIEQSVILNQLDGFYTVEKVSLQRLHSKVMQLKAEVDPTMGSLTFEHIAKSLNADSNQLAVKALETHVSVNVGDDKSVQSNTAYDPSLLTIDPMIDSLPTSLVSGSDAGAEDRPSDALNTPESFAADTSPRSPAGSLSIDPSMTYLLQFDGGSRGNPGVAGAGMVIFDDKGQEVWCGWKYLSRAMTNNQAEYNALQLGLECARSLGIERIRVEGDSELVIKQVTGVYKVKNDGLKLLWQQSQEEVREFKHCNFKHIFRENNKRADWLANNAMDQKSSYGFVEEPQ